MKLLQSFVDFIARAPTGMSAGAPVKKGGENVGYWNKISAGDSGIGATLTQPYRWSAWVHRAINIKAGEISSVPLEFMDGENDFEGDDEFDEFWQAPALGPEGQRIPIGEVEAMLLGWLDLKGQNFIILDDSYLVPFTKGRYAPFIVARPDRMRRIVTGRQLLGYAYTDAVGMTHALLPEQVICTKFWNPYDLWDGLAPMDAAQNAAEADYLAGLYVRNLMRNNGDQGVFVIDKDGMPADDTKLQIVEALREKRNAALQGQFKPVFLGGNISIEDAKAKAPDGDMVASRIQNRHEIFAAFGVPMSMADVTVSYSIGSASDQYQLIEGTCIPLGKKIVAPFGVIATMQTGKKLVAALDWDEHRIMQQVRLERLKSADSLWSKGMPMSEINDYLSLGMAPFPGWDVGYLPFSVVPLTDMGTPPTESTPTDTTPAKDDEAATPLKESFNRLRALFANAQDKMDAVERSREVPAELKGRPEKEIAHWRALMAQRRDAEKRTHSAVTRNLMAARAEVLRKIATNVPEESSKSAVETVARSGLAASLNFNKHDFATGLKASLSKAAKFNVQEAGEQLLLSLGSDSVFDVADEKVLLFIKERNNKLVDVPDEIWNTIQTQLDEGLSAGEGRGELSNRIREAFNVINRGRANTIAQTETAAAYGYGRKEGMSQGGVGWQQWLAAADDKVRDAHAEANGQTVPIDEPFEVDGESLDYPGDGDGSAGNVINCRCVAIPLLDGPDGEAVKGARKFVAKKV